MRDKRSRLAKAAAIWGAALIGGGAIVTATSAAGTPGRAASAPSAVAAVQKFLKPPTALVVNTPLPKRPPVVKAVFLSNGIAIAQQISAGMQAASSALGWHYSTMSIDQNNPTTIPSGMLSAINGGAKVVFVSATPTAVFQGALATAKQHGTVVIDVASGNTPTSGVAALVNNAAANGPEWGSMLALGALADAQDSHDKNASILLVTAPLFETILGPTDTAVAATVKKYCGGCGLDTLGIPANDLFGGKAPADIVSYMQAHPDVKYILQDSSLTDPGLTAALSGAGFGKVKVLGVAPLALQVASVRSGTELGWVVDPLNVEGWMAVDAAARKITGAKATAYNTKGIPSYLLVKSNSHDATEVPSGYQQMFKRLWHVSH